MIRKTLLIATLLMLPVFAVKADSDWHHNNHHDDHGHRHGHHGYHLYDNRNYYVEPPHYYQPPGYTPQVVVPRLWLDISPYDGRVRGGLHFYQ